MKYLFDGGVVIMIVILALALVGSLSHKISNKPHHTGNEAFKGHDAEIEELCEEIHGAITGTKQDFTPESPEQK